MLSKFKSMREHAGLQYRKKKGQSFDSQNPDLFNERNARKDYFLSISPAKMSFLCVPFGTNKVPITTVITAIMMAYHRPE